MADVTLRPVTDDNRAEVTALRVTSVQEEYVASVADSFADAERYPEAMPRYWAIYADEAPVGFLMISDNVPPGDPEILGPYFLWRLLIDAGHQGRGYGRAALAALGDYLSTRPGAIELLTSVHPGEIGSPMGFYLRLGFQDTGVDHDGERVLRLPL
ncbi:GNAT family N-acetyltransferase [Herbidospora mongoliensis]|uniref:GNAT family N-acetyltransferase n=1 Tax=Herbidospora mongoliensis TaxID=688067 RepID=UPI00082EA071|nr:GNAT family N-acetyltransferase [Herbidospora mongoliensis]